MPEEKGRAPGEPMPWSREGEDEPEPDWAEQIRRGRKARGERLKHVFATFEDEAELPQPPRD